MNWPSLQSALAALFLLLTISLPIVWILRRLPKQPVSFFQSLLWGLAWLLVKFQWRASLPGRLPIPDNQGAIVVSNHRSSVDPFFIQVSTSRKVHYMVAREYCIHPAFGPMLRTCEVIPVGRGGVDTAATKSAIRLVANGGLVGMFPEGRINMTDELLLPGRPGAVLIALKGRVPILPCYIEGSPYYRTSWSPFLMRARVRIQFGEPIDLSEYYGREQEPGVLPEVMQRCLKAVAALAGQPAFQPKMAGRNWKPTTEEIEADMAAGEARRRQKPE
jgi:1-acyl-sn-glycerol-3-phosphate acyltransferase